MKLINENRLEIEKIENINLNDKIWTVVLFKNKKFWIPSLIEQAFIAQKVALCERTKYPNLKWDPALLPKEFLKRAINGENICFLSQLGKFNLIHTKSYKKFCLLKE